LAFQNITRFLECEKAGHFFVFFLVRFGIYFLSYAV